MSVPRSAPAPQNCPAEEPEVFGPEEAAKTLLLIFEKSPRASVSGRLVAAKSVIARLFGWAIENHDAALEKITGEFFTKIEETLAWLRNYRGAAWLDLPQNTRSEAQEIAREVHHFAKTLSEILQNEPARAA